MARMGRVTTRCLFIALFVHFLAACGLPPDRDLGQAAILAFPLAMIAGLLVHYIHFRLRIPLSNEIGIRWFPSITILVFGSLIAMVLFQLSLLEDGLFYAEVAVIYGGISYISILFIVTSIWAHFSTRAAFTWSPVIVMILFVLPALPLAFSSSSGSPFVSFLFLVWLLPNYLLPIVPLTMIVLAYRNLQRRRKQDHNSGP